MLSPASWAAKALRGRESTCAVGPCSTTAPCSSTITRSARSRASRASWVTRTTRAVGQHPAQRLPQRRRDRDVEGGHRLVEQQQPRLGGQGPGDGDALGLTAGDLAGPPVGQVRGARPRSSQRSAASCGGRAPGARAARPEGDVVAHVEVREQQRLLGEQRDLPVVRAPRARRPPPPPGQHPVVEHDAAPVGPEQAGGHARARSTCRRRWARAARRSRRRRPSKATSTPRSATAASYANVTARSAPDGRSR